MPPDAAVPASGSEVAEPGRTRMTGLRARLKLLLPAIALIVMLAVIFYLQPRAMSYNGMRILLGFSLPLIFAAMAQLCIIAASDIDLGLGTFIGLVNSLS